MKRSFVSNKGCFFLSRDSQAATMIFSTNKREGREQSAEEHSHTRKCSWHWFFYYALRSTRLLWHIDIFVIKTGGRGVHYPMIDNLKQPINQDWYFWFALQRRRNEVKILSNFNLFHILGNLSKKKNHMAGQADMFGIIFFPTENETLGLYVQ